GRDRDDDAGLVASRDLELAPFADRRLVDVAREDEVHSGSDQRSEHMVSPRHWFLPRAPGCADQVVVEDDDLERAGLRLAQPLLRPFELAGADPARLVSPRSHGVEADD